MVLRAAAIAAALLAAPAVDPRREAVEEGIEGLRANEAGRFAEAIPHHDRSIRLKPTASAYANRARAHLGLGRYLDALRDADEAIRMDRRHVWAWLHRARALQGLGRDEEALRACAEAVRLAPDLGDARACRGVILLALSRHAEAAADLRAALEVQGWTHREAIDRAALAALALRRDGREAEARALLDEAADRIEGANGGAWPAPVLDYLRRQVSAEALLEAAGAPKGADSAGRRPAEARAYVGLDLAPDAARETDALRHLEAAAAAAGDADVLRLARADRNRIRARLAAAAESAGRAAPGGVEVVNRDRPGQPVDLARFVVPGKTTIFDVYSEYCGPCVAVAPMLEELARRRPDIAVRKIDINRPGVQGIDWSSPAAEAHVSPGPDGERGIPYFKVYGPDGRLVAEGSAASAWVYRALEEAGIR